MFGQVEALEESEGEGGGLRNVTLKVGPWFENLKF
jgi:protein subunit release factor B